ncbi:phosphoinositide 3-kinase regulatory subunit 6 [Tupaia chinensis]|uniref:phosphoinositide 3-kinase regulatory subunit 6 n=1 Tax=Tupaia chinensis TaxID=246437 RepID=UPI000FFC03EE|nr:phosphoinositide 3-kinase regulatory subunit 6 [Tupaia chinensis]
MESSDVELDLQRSVQAVLRELSAHAPALQSNQGMGRWSLHKKVERDPAKSPALVRILLRELEKAESEDLRHVIIPLLHTLMYVLTKATGITEELYQRTYTFCTRLLTLPTPYCTVALDCAIRLKTETAVPGTLYQRTVIAEQSLVNELYPYQERVFLFVDPELVSASVCSALLLEIEAAQEQQTPEACMRHVVSHALQAALGEACQAGVLHRKLQASPRCTLERYFHAVVAAVEQMASEANPSRAGYLERLEEIYSSLLGPAAAAGGRCGGKSGGRVCRGCGPPGAPESSAGAAWSGRAPGAARGGEVAARRSSAGTWQDWGLRRWAIRRDLLDHPFPICATAKGVCPPPRLALCILAECQGRPDGSGPSLYPQESVTSRHPELGELATFLGRADPWYESTVNTLCPAIHKLAQMPPCLDTSRAVDPFILDVITYYIRMGTQPIYFQIYTVKIFNDLSQNPTEDIFLSELKVKIQESKLLKDGFSSKRRGVAEGPGAELSLCYQKGLLSHRPREVTISLRAAGLVLKAIPASDTEVSGPPPCLPTAAPFTDHTCLNVSVTEVVKSSNLAGRSFSMVTNTFRTANIQIQSQDQRLLTLSLDKDSRRTFRDVVRFEVFPCPEPCSGSQKSKTLWLNSQGQKEVETAKVKPRPLQMPINTFSGIVQ